MTDRWRVALTFDAEHPDRPAVPGATERVLDILRERQTRATFFVQGRWVEAEPALARRIVADGHLVGHHSHYHARAPLLSAEGFAEDVRDAERVIVDTLGVDPRPWYRLPFGAGAGDPAIHRRLDAIGYRHVHWDLEVWEWRPEATAEGVEEATVAGALSHGDGAVVLLHPWPTPVPAALPGIIDRLDAAGARFVDLRELDRTPDGLGATPPA